MYLMYVDESGDPGLVPPSKTTHFILSAIVLHESNWSAFLNNMLIFRRHLKARKGLLIKDEIHAAEFIRGNIKSKTIRNIKKHDRLDIIKQCIIWLSMQSNIRIISVCVNKAGRTDDIFNLAWNALINRFENTLGWGNFVGSQNAHDQGIIISDNTNDKKLTGLIRKMRHFNLVPNHRTYFAGGARNLTLTNVIEDPTLRDSKNSLTHQMVDVVAYSLRQMYQPNSYLRKRGGAQFYARLLPVILKKASPRHPLGVVEL
ncbi:MAG TPA: DUF3800 domain-containing protein [Bacteroidia bacterium]|nr:DUF3800 domain-containing protein [Bacteroidia bacterium]